MSSPQLNLWPEDDGPPPTPAEPGWVYPVWPSAGTGASEAPDRRPPPSPAVPGPGPVGAWPAPGDPGLTADPRIATERQATAYDALAALQGRLTAETVAPPAVVGACARIGWLHRLGVPRQRVLLQGPAGCGKSTLAAALAQALDVPTVTVSATGWAAVPVPDALRVLLEEAGGDLTRARRGVVIVDHAEALALRGARHDRAWRRCRQDALLPLLEGAVVLTPDPFAGVIDGPPTIPFPTAELLVILTGFPRLRGPLSADALERHGLRPEVVSRIGPLVAMPALSEAQARRLLAREVDAWRPLAARCGLTLAVESGALAVLAARLARAGTVGDGWQVCEALRTLLERQLAWALTQGDSALRVLPDDVGWG